MSDEGSRLFDETWLARRRLRRWTALAVTIVAVGRLGAEVAPILRRPDLVLLDLWQSVRATQRPSPQVVIVGIDEKSIARIGPPAWPRNEYVPLIERLSVAGARVIGFDFTFAALDREAKNNRLLADAMRKAGNVVFGFEFRGVGDPSPPGHPPSELMQANALSRFEMPAIPPASGLIDPEPVLADAAAALGHVGTIESEDARIRVMPLVIQHANKAYPSLALQIARVYTKTPLSQIEVRGGVVALGEVVIPVSGSGELLLNWPAAGEQAFTRHSFLDVVRGDVPEEAFRDKAVLVAGTADGLDDRDFPFAVEAPGVLTYATFLDNVFRVDFVQAPTWAWVLEWLLFMAVCGLGLWLLPRLSTPWLLAGVPALALLVLGGAAFLFVQKGIWVKVIYPCVALVVPLAVTLALKLTATEKEAHDVAAEKLESQKLLGLSFQEKGMLDMALATFNKLPSTEDMKLVYVNLALDYENRGQREKALLVYKKVFDIDPGVEDVASRMERLGQTSAAAPAAVASPGQAGAQTPGPAVTARPASAASTSAVAAGHAVTAMLPRQPSAPSESRADSGKTSVPGPTLQMPPTVVGPPDLSGTAPSGPVPAGARFGRYVVEQHLGRGGMGDVYLVRDTIINRRAALKTIRHDANIDAQQVIEIRQRFYREAQTAGQLTHPNIVTLYDVGEDLGMSYIVMEFVEGQTLAERMKKQKLTIPQIKHVVYHAGLGLDFAHQHGVVHRDIKPDNVMISKAGLVKVMDFGIARIVESSLTKTGSVMGTPAYMSPEQVNGQKVDARSDIFSLGVILYELLTGTKPFSGETVPSLMFAIIKADFAKPSTLDAKIHPAWDEILQKALAKERSERYARARDLALAIKDAPAR